MTQPFIGEIRMFAGNFAPAGWAFCDGQTMAISENDALFTLIGTTYGGDGQETFQLPNLQSRFPLHMGTGSSGTTYQLGEMAGVEEVTLTTQQIPQHSHTLMGSGGTASSRNPQNLLYARSAGDAYTTVMDPVPISASTVNGNGASQPHENMPPFLCINFIISLYGVFPSQN